MRTCLYCENRNNLAVYCEPEFYVECSFCKSRGPRRKTKADAIYSWDNVSLDQRGTMILAKIIVHQLKSKQSYRK